jgi:hypothetical protein
MRAIHYVPILGAALLAMTGCEFEDFGNLQRYRQDFHYSYPLKATGAVSVESFNGSIEITGWDQNTVDISGEKYGPTQDAADSLKIDITNTADSVSIRAVRPSERRNNTGARFVVKVPRAALLDRITTSNGAIRTLDGTGPARLRTSNGQIRVQDLKGNLDAQTSNGSVEIASIDGDARLNTSNGHIRSEALHGSLDANTSNGSIDARIAEGNRPVRLDTSNGRVEVTLPASHKSDVHVSTSNGSITVHMPHDVNARVMAHTSNSSITSDFEMRVSGAFSKNRMEGTIGEGGPLLDLGTSNGSIHLVKQ